MFLGETALVDLPTPPYHVLQPGQPIAVLTNEITTSAGEMVAIAFRGWPHTRSFGQRTLGRTTAPEGFTLSDGAILGISVAYFTDHNGEIYRGKITPDDIIVNHDNPILRDRDVPQPAMDWLLNQPSCSER
jgi:C-terminal processing protease CtpA/Prc